MSSAAYTEGFVDPERWVRLVAERARVEKLIRDLGPEDHEMRLVYIALQHEPEHPDDPNPHCVECGHDWPCITRTRATGERRR